MKETFYLGIDEVRGALARGYCSKENELKELDGDLLEACRIEIFKLLLDKGWPICIC